MKLVNSFEDLVYKLQNMEEVADGEFHFEDEEKDVPICDFVKEMERLIQELQNVHGIWNNVTRSQSLAQEFGSKKEENGQFMGQENNARKRKNPDGLIDNIKKKLDSLNTAIRNRNTGKQKGNTFLQWTLGRLLLNADKGFVVLA
jgi:hypothetical protein